MRNLVCIFFAVCLSCQQAPKGPTEIVQHRLTQIAERESFGDWGVLNGMFGMTYNEGQLFLPDYDESRVLVTTPDLQPAYHIGGPGQGPGELANASFTTVAQGRVFVKSSANQLLAVYDTQGTFLNVVPVPGFILCTRYAAYEETLFLSSATAQQPITALDFDGNKLYQMGTTRFSGDFQKQRARNHKHLAVTQLNDIPTLVAVGDTEPEIELFSLEGEHLYTHDLSNHPALELRLLTAKEVYANPQKKGVSVQLFADMAVAGDQLLCFVYGQQPPYAILRFQLAPKKVVFRDLLRIEEPLDVRSMAYDGISKVFIFDGRTHRVKVYELPPPAIS